MTITPNAPYDKSPLLPVLMVWREARGCPIPAKLGVVWTLRNRNAMAPAQGFKPTMDEEILRHSQFSSFNADDPNSTKYPDSLDDPIWQDCQLAVDSDAPDPTGGAVFYFSKPITEPPAAWGDVDVSAVIGGLTFCRIKQAATTHPYAVS